MTSQGNVDAPAERRYYFEHSATDRPGHPNVAAVLNRELAGRPERRLEAVLFVGQSADGHGEYLVVISEPEE